MDIKYAKSFLRKCCKPRIEEICNGCGLTQRQKTIIIQSYILNKYQDILCDEMAISKRTLCREKAIALRKICDYLTYNDINS